MDANFDLLLLAVNMEGFEEIRSLAVFGFSASCYLVLEAIILVFELIIFCVFDHFDYFAEYTHFISFAHLGILDILFTWLFG